MTKMTKKKQKELMRNALRLSLGNVTVSCKAVNISRETHYRWMREDKNYKSFVEGLPEEEVEFYENALRKKIEAGDTASIIFALKSKGKHKGWVEKQEIAHSGQISNIQINLIEKSETELKRLKNG